MSVKALEKVAKIIEKGVAFCDDCVKKDCRFRGIVWDCDDKRVEAKKTLEEKK